jgi:hypothetical protein
MKTEWDRAYLARKPAMIAAPDKVLACHYCGEQVFDTWRSCCGEVHFEEVLRCPECGDDVSTERLALQSCETYQHVCNSCDYRSEPE